MEEVLGAGEVLQSQLPENPSGKGHRSVKRHVTIFSSLLLLAVAAFCVFGFMATFEPEDNTTQFMAFRIGYVVVGVGCLLGMAFLISKTLRK